MEGGPYPASVQTPRSPQPACFAPAFAPAHRLEQYFTVSQSFAHFLRQAKGRPQDTQIFVGRVGFLWAMSGCQVPQKVW